MSNNIILINKAIDILYSNKFLTKRFTKNFIDMCTFNIEEMINETDHSKIYLVNLDKKNITVECFVNEIKIFLNTDNSSFTGNILNMNANLTILNGLLHSTNNNAAYKSDKLSCWYKDGLLHRDNGPAVIITDQEKMKYYYYNNGDILNQDEFIDMKKNTPEYAEIFSFIFGNRHY